MKFHREQEKYLFIAFLSIHLLFFIKGICETFFLLYETCFFLMSLNLFVWFTHSQLYICNFYFIIFLLPGIPRSFSRLILLLLLELFISIFNEFQIEANVLCKYSRQVSSFFDKSKIYTFNLITLTKLTIPACSSTSSLLICINK